MFIIELFRILRFLKLEPMKRLVALMMCAVSLGAKAQGTSIYDYPFNPDANGDNFVGVVDLQSFLATYGSEYGLPPEPCDYDGTEFEEFVGGLISQTIVLDSLFISYQLTDVSTYYLPGCPTPVTDTLVYARQGVCYNASLGADRFQINGYLSGNTYHKLEVLFDLSQGTYKWYFSNYSSSFDAIGNEGFFGGSQTSGTQSQSIPWPDSWILDESGIQIEFTTGWARDEFVDFMQILPYWHYAE